MVDVPQDPYRKLRPPGLTPDEELCHCPGRPAVMLRDGFGDYPLFCVACVGEVSPQRIGFDEALAEEIADWLSVANALYRLWFDSRDYEEWAAARLSDPDGQVNRTGLEIVGKLNRFTLAYYWWFQDIGAESYRAPEHCPVCRGPLGGFPGRSFQTCTRCKILI